MKKGLFLSLLLCFVALSAAQSVTAEGVDPDDAPQPAAATSLLVSGIPEFQTLSTATQSLDVVISVDAPAIPPTGRAAVSISEVLDRSGSMRGAQLNNVKESAKFLATLLEEDDHAGIISFSGQATTVLDLTEVTSPVSSFQTLFDDAVDSLVARGETNLSDGLFDGIDQQTEANLAGKVPKGVFLFTDGRPSRGKTLPSWSRDTPMTVGITDLDTILSTMETELDVDNPPRVHTLGFGGDHDADFLQAIAVEGGGDYFFVESADDIPSVIGLVMGGLLSVAAQDIVVDLTPLNGATITSTTGGTANADNTQITFSDIWADESKKVLVSMEVPVLDDALEDQEVLRVTVTYCNIYTQEIESTTFTIVVQRVVVVVPAAPATEVEQTRLRFQAADDLQTAVAQREAGDEEGASATLDGTLATLQASPEASSPEVRALISDVESAKGDVEGADFSQEKFNRLTAGSESLATGRASGAGFRSVQPTSTQSLVAAETTAAVIGRQPVT